MLRKLGMILLVLPAMAAELPGQGVHTDAYNLHQALNYFNVFTSGNCELAGDLALKHLSKLKPSPGEKPFGEITAALKKFNKPSAKDVTELELLRKRFGETLDANHIEHKMAWHREVHSFCPSAPRLE